MTKLTNEEIEARIKAAKMKNTKSHVKINNSKLLADSGLSIVHINNHPEHYRSMTVAYQVINRSHIKIATAVVHRADNFARKIGTKLAIENFQKGNTIVLPASKFDSPVNQLWNMFGQIE